MKRKVILLGLLVVGVNVSAAPTEFQFVSTLSAPVASFKEVETKESKPVKINSGAEMNIGSSVASKGTVKLNNKALVTRLYMEDKTVLEVVNGRVWTVGQLYVGTSGDVSPQNLLVSTLNIGDAQHQNTSLTLDANTMKTEGNVIAKTVTVTGELDVNDSGHPENRFVFGKNGTGGGTGDASFASPIARTQTEINVRHTPEAVSAILRTGN